MDAFLEQFQYLQIQPEEITSATDNLNDEKNCIGVGGFGKVYKGEVSHSKGRSMAAVKRLDRRHGQGTPEFLKEITMLSRYNHENLISLLGFCYKRDEMILVYEHASHGSLDHHLNSPHLTWSKRLKICLDVAKGLSYLHDPRETHQRLIHCDVKSANILLDDQWNGKLSDFGLSIMGPANEQQSVIVTFAAGTPGYYDPQYAMTHTLTKESDVYSFGVILFEVLCGILCCTYSNGGVQQILVPTWSESYKQKKLNDIIFKNTTFEQLDQSSLKTFSDIAYRCLKESREERPKMVEIVTKLESALECQKLVESRAFIDWKAQLFYYEELTKSSKPPLNYSSNGELWKLLSKGVLLNDDKTWFSLNKEGEHCEMISFAKCLDSAPNNFFYHPRWHKYNSRFPMDPYHYKNGRVKTHVKAQFLSPLITYTVNLVFKFPQKGRKCQDHISLQYKLQGKTETSISYLAYEREDGWWACELYQFTSDHKTIDFEIQFDGFNDPYGDSYDVIEVEGIEFLPLEKVEHKVSEDGNLDMQPISDSDANWEETLPTDYEDIMKWSKDIVQWTTKKEAYSIIRKGLLINDGQIKWFSIDKNGKKYHMLSATAARIWIPYNDRASLPESRFGEAFVLRGFSSFAMDGIIQSQLVSSQTTYASYLVYKLSKDQSGFEAPMLLEGEVLGSYFSWYFYFLYPQTPVIRPKAGQKTHNPVNRPRLKVLPKERNDGWMEVQIWEFRTATTTEMIPMHFKLSTCGKNDFSGLIIEGIEFRPI